MTCDQPGGRVAVSEVKGFISFAGKTGVRGKVVSREGSLVTQAFIAGIAGGVGRGFRPTPTLCFRVPRQSSTASASNCQPVTWQKPGLARALPSQPTWSANI